MVLMNITVFPIPMICGRLIMMAIPIAEKDTSSPKMRFPVLPLIEGNEKVGEVRTLSDQDKLTTSYTEHAIKFIEEHKNESFLSLFSSINGTCATWCIR